MPVKGRRIPVMTVVPLKPGRRLLAWLFVAVLVLLVAASGYFAGRWQVLRELAPGAGGSDLARLEQLLGENQALREEVALKRHDGDVTREVEEQVRQDNLQLQERVAELEEAIAYYRKVAIPDRSGKGLRLERLEVVPTNAPGVWALRLALVRTGETDGSVEGRIEGALVVRTAAGEQRLPWAQLLRPERQQFSVRYVEDMTSEFRLPEGSVPVRADIVAVITAPRPDRVEKQWNPQAAKPGSNANAG